MNNTLTLVPPPPLLPRTEREHLNRQLAMARAQLVRDLAAERTALMVARIAEDRNEIGRLEHQLAEMAGETEGRR